MKNIKRLVLGVVSSLLLAAGFAWAADRLDPVLVDVRAPAVQPDGIAANCTLPCNHAGDV
ncbi:MAG: hypothetical protein HY736_10750 [Verrucomicrobia bacterium]|nr:hypothetical protein [Verrucomicrobiota bacterium]